MTTQKKISDLAITQLKKNNKAMAHLMIYFDRGQWTIENWISPSSPKHHRLVEPGAVEILKSQLGLSESELLEPFSKDIQTAA